MKFETLFTWTPAYPFGPRKRSHSKAISFHFHSNKCTITDLWGAKFGFFVPFAKFITNAIQMTNSFNICMSGRSNCLLTLFEFVWLFSFSAQWTYNFSQFCSQLFINNPIGNCEFIAIFDSRKIILSFCTILLIRCFWKMCLTNMIFLQIDFHESSSNALQAVTFDKPLNYKLIDICSRYITPWSWRIGGAGVFHNRNCKDDKNNEQYWFNRKFRFCFVLFSMLHAKQLSRCFFLNSNWS